MSVSELPMTGSTGADGPAPRTGAAAARDAAAPRRTAAVRRAAGNGNTAAAAGGGRNTIGLSGVPGPSGARGASGTDAGGGPAGGSGRAKAGNGGPALGGGPATGLADVIELPRPRSPEAPPAPGRVACRWPAYVLIASGVLLVPWLVVLALTLPRMTVAWVGLDAMETAGLLATGLLVLRGHPLRAGAGIATATLLLVDAWFDSTTSHGSEFVLALVLAGVTELPLAALCATLAVRALSLRGPQESAA